MGIEHKGIGSPFKSKFGEEFAERFWSKVEKTDGCWLWVGSRLNNGYGVFRIWPRTITAHRFAWINTNGPIENGLCVLHKCDVRLCVNPAHLFTGTKTDNMKDCAMKGRLGHGISRGEDSATAKLTGAQVLMIRSLYLSAPWGKKRLVAQRLAGIIGVRPSTIAQAAQGHTWGHL